MAKTETKAPVLPAGITAKDLTRPKWDDKDGFARDSSFDTREFELWHTPGFGWCIPTLDIAAGRRGQPRRTYAVLVRELPKLSAGEAVTVARIGQGPHVTSQQVVYVRASRLKALQPFLDLRTAGLAAAGQVRDRISSRRAQGQQEREAGNHSWRWRV
jgi:hypothetical protein